MLFPFKSSFSRPLALLGLLGLALMQMGCAHPVVVEPSVSVHSRIGHVPVYTQVGVPDPVYYAPPRVIYAPPRVIYAPPPPPRVVYVPRIHVPRVHVPQGHPPAQIWGHGHDRGHRGQERRQLREEERERGGWRGQRDQREQWQRH
ncbi:hypothetical protein [Limnohabitans sp. 63ED37-2]|uniref:hypothetical protein n=1 Tax=Limnohabitans sp. 63ED37-2 TaxID=1678128 RepID=UPI0007069740|nr:hypothetical protein L63ED372_02162 [Limnohabitans sp. 63ED37-2]